VLQLPFTQRKLGPMGESYKAAKVATVHFCTFSGDCRNVNNFDWWSIGEPTGYICHVLRVGKRIAR
jgi:hypothetical protein